MGVELLPGSLDNYAICTSSTRPAHRSGLMIYETDTNRVYISSGTTWLYNSGGTDPLGARVYRSTALSLTVGGTPTLVPFNAESWDSGGNFSTVTGRYTSAENTHVRIDARVSIVAAAVGERFITTATYNAVEVSRGTDVTARGADRVTCEVHCVVGVLVGDIVDFRVQQVNGTSRAIDVGTDLAYMAVTRA